MHRTADDFLTVLMADCKNSAIHRLLEADGNYLKRAYDSVEALWHAEYEKFTDIHLVLLSEAPLFGEGSSYIYNPLAKATTFLNYMDFADVFGAYARPLPAARRPKIERKTALIDGLRACGVIVIDLFPFALNASTSMSYAEVDATELFNATCEHFFRPKLAAVLKKANTNTLFLFRYERVRAACFDMVSQEFERLEPDRARLIPDKISGRRGVLLRNQLRAVYERARCYQ